jgi:rSAM/selenodomain-associated transferase 2
MPVNALGGQRAARFRRRARIGRAGPACYRRPVKLAVVIPALDEAEWIAGAIASAAEEGVDVVVADGGSRDGTPDRAAAAGARVVESPPGRARQLQAGVEASQGDVLLLLHADTRLAPGFTAEVGGALRDPGVVGGAFRLCFDRSTPSLRIVEWGARLRVALFELPYGDQALFVRRTTLDAIGGIPQEPIMEDLDLVVAMRRRGRLVILPLPAITSARRYLANGVWRTMALHWLAAGAWTLGVDRERIARWVRR